MSTIATAYVQVLPSTQGMKSALTSSIGQMAPGVGKELGTGISESASKSMISGAAVSAMAAAGAAIGAALVTGVKKSIEEGAGMEQAIGGIETLFKNNAQTVIDNATNAYRTAGLSAREYMENVTSFSASLLQALGGNTRKAADIADMAMQDMSDNANKMGTDMAAIQNAYQGFAKQNYTMLDNLKIGYGGTKTEMQRLLADAQKLSGVRYDISNLSDVYSAIHVIQQELGITGTTAEEAASTVSGSFNMVKAALQNTFAGLAGQMNLEEALQGLGDSFDTFFNENLIPMIENVFDSIPQIISSVLTSGFMDGISKTTKSIVGAIGKLATGIAEAFATALQLAPVIAMAMLKGIAEALPQIIEGLGDMFERMGERMPEFAELLIKELPSLIFAIVEALIKLIPALIEAGIKLAGGLIAGFVQAIGELISELPSLVASIGDAFSPLASILGGVAQTAVSYMAEAFAPVSDYITQQFGGLGESLSALFAAIGGTISSAVELIKTLFAPVTDYIGGVFERAVDMMRAAFGGVGSIFSNIVTQIKNVFNQVVAYFSQIGERMIQALQEGITRQFQQLIQKVQDFINMLTGMFTGISTQMDMLTDKISWGTSTSQGNLNSLSNSMSKATSRSVYNEASMISPYSEQQPIQINVVLSGSAKDVFDSVRVENSKFVTATGYKALA